MRDQAVERGYQRNSIELEEWYRNEGNGRLIWHGKGLKESPVAEAFSVRVDEVWTPSGG